MKILFFRPFSPTPSRFYIKSLTEFYFFAVVVMLEVYSHGISAAGSTHVPGFIIIQNYVIISSDKMTDLSSSHTLIPCGFLLPLTLFFGR